MKTEQFSNDKPKSRFAISHHLKGPATTDYMRSWEDHCRLRCWITSARHFGVSKVGCLMRWCGSSLRIFKEYPVNTAAMKPYWAVIKEGTAHSGYECVLSSDPHIQLILPSQLFSETVHMDIQVQQRTQISHMKIRKSRREYVGIIETDSCGPQF